MQASFEAPPTHHPQKTSFVILGQFSLLLPPLLPIS
jgi:hypothetical protein